MWYPTPEFLRSMAEEEGVSDDVRAFALAAADALAQRGFYATADLLLITAEKALSVETRAIAEAAQHPPVPGWRFFFEGKVYVNEGGTDLAAVLVVESTENRYGTCVAAVAASVHAMKQAGLEVRRLTRAQKKAAQPMYILPSYIGVATDQAGKVIE
jgi:hypothetical protein